MSDISKRYIQATDGAHRVLELAILGLLKEQPLHGYGLKKRLGDTLGFLWGVSYGSLYPALRRLERAGAIEIVPPGPAAPTSTPAPMPATGSIAGETAAARLRRLPKPTRRTQARESIPRRGDRYLRSLAEHRTESTARDLAWLDELIAVERRAVHPEQ